MYAATEKCIADSNGLVVCRIAGVAIYGRFGAGRLGVVESVVVGVCLFFILLVVVLQERGVVYLPPHQADLQIDCANEGYATGGVLCRQFIAA